MVKHELRVPSSELRVKGLKAGVESLKKHELKFKSASSNQIHELPNPRVTSSNPLVTCSNPLVQE